MPRRVLGDLWMFRSPSPFSPGSGMALPAVCLLPPQTPLLPAPASPRQASFPYYFVMLKRLAGPKTGNRTFIDKVISSSKPDVSLEHCQVWLTNKQTNKLILHMFYTSIKTGIKEEKKYYCQKCTLSKFLGIFRNPRGMIRDNHFMSHACKHQVCLYVFMLS